ncbi:hypothetical protein V5799_004014 [Amblyomma americanum]|uniref:Secreted protein n=1 Tax=Amblyomma americanum TaxID=6943 RepID=A0AAQ4D7B0_AMBAM
MILIVMVTATWINSCVCVVPRTGEGDNAGGLDIGHPNLQEQSSAEVVQTSVPAGVQETNVVDSLSRTRSTYHPAQPTPDCSTRMPETPDFSQVMRESELHGYIYRTSRARAPGCMFRRFQGPRAKLLFYCPGLRSFPAQSIHLAQLLRHVPVEAATVFSPTYSPPAGGTVFGDLLTACHQRLPTTFAQLFDHMKADRFTKIAHGKHSETFRVHSYEGDSAFKVVKIDSVIKSWDAVFSKMLIAS